MKSEAKLKTRIGRIAYTNCLPFYHRLNENADFTFEEAVPAQINSFMRRDKLDIAPISSLEYLNNQKHYLLLPSFAIGARDFSGSVLLLSNEKIEGLNGAPIALSRESLSSSALLRILLKFKYKFDNTFTQEPSQPDEMLNDYPAALVIGDGALFYQPKRFIYKYDLSELWWNWTEKPFCFALWAVRRAYAQENPEEVASFCRRLKRTLNKNLADLETLVKESLNLNFMDDKFSKVFGYLFNLNYGLDAPMREGLELFYRLAHRLKISPKPGPLQFFNADVG